MSSRKSSSSAKSAGAKSGKSRRLTSRDSGDSIGSGRKKLLADAMLGSVARKLRIFGFDTAYVAHTDDDYVLKMATEQGRIILTADKEFFKRLVSRGADGILVEGASELADLEHILARLGVKHVDVDLGSRCAACNGLLEQRAPAQVSVPEAVAGSKEEFYQCADCGKVYWDGGHVKRLRALAATLERRLAARPAASKG